MILHQPVVITSRLLPGLHFRTPEGLVQISIEYRGVTQDHRTRYQWHIDGIGKKSFSGTDLNSGCGGGSLQEGLTSLLSFLTAAAEGFQFEERNPGLSSDNADAFPKPVVEWAAQHSDELSMAQLEIEESPTPVM